MKLRLYLLLINSRKEEHSWKMASSWVESRDATQIRTHVQKFKTSKLNKWIKRLDEISDHLKKKTQLPSPALTRSEPLLSEEQRAFLTGLIEDYVQMQIISKVMKNKICSDQLLQSPKLPEAAKAVYSGLADGCS